jgi:hypothetical protein
MNSKNILVQAGNLSMFKYVKKTEGKKPKTGEKKKPQYVLKDAISIIPL